MPKRTDKQRLDFLQAQPFTKWVGYGNPDGGRTTWPVFQHGNLREEIDHAMDSFEHFQKPPEPPAPAEGKAG